MTIIELLKWLWASVSRRTEADTGPGGHITPDREIADAETEAELQEPQPEIIPPEGENTRIDEMLDTIMVHEKGFQRWKEDNGNWTGGKRGRGTLIGTNWGITPIQLAKWRRIKPSQVTVAMMRQLEQSEARDIFKANYYIGPKINLLPDLIEPVTFDLGINGGPSRGVKTLQRVLNKAGFPCSADGKIGPETVRQSFAAARAMGGYLVNAYCDERIAFYKRIIARNSSQKKFWKGWKRRADSFRVAV